MQNLRLMAFDGPRVKIPLSRLGKVLVFGRTFKEKEEGVEVTLRG